MNGVKAPMRYVLCTCSCHDGDHKALNAVTTLLKGWDVPPPLSASNEELSRFVDLVNVLASPGFHPVHDEDLDDDD